LDAKKSIDQNRFEEAKILIKNAEKIDSDVAELQWQKARLNEKTKNFAKAKVTYKLASDLDGRPWRNLSEFSDGVREISKDENTLLFDSQKALESASPQGLLGKELIIDNCHPNLKGQFILARGILNTLYENNIIAHQKEWKFKNLKTPKFYTEKLFPTKKELAESHFRTGTYILTWVPLRYDPKLRLKMAISFYDQALELWPDYPEALWTKGLALKILKDHEEGNKNMLKARDLKADIDDELKGLSALLKPLAVLH